MDTTAATTSAAHPDDTTDAGIAWVDGTIVDAAEATVPLVDDGFLRGDAVFESVLVRRGATHALDEHLARMRRSARAIDLPLPELGEVVDDLLAAWGRRNGSMKLIVTRSGTVRGILFPVTEWPASVSLATVEVPWRSALSGVKTLSYAANQWAKREAAARGADDALIVDDGVVHELATGTIVAVHDGVLTSPDAATTPILDSVTLEVLRRDVEIAAGRLDLEALLASDELFVVSATRPVIAVHELILTDGDRRPLDAPGPVTARARAALQARIDAEVDAGH